MIIDQKSAAVSLSGIQQAEHRTFQAMFYGITGPILIAWGVVTAAGYVLSHAYGRQAYLIWPLVQTAGFSSMLVLLYRTRSSLTARQRELGWRLLAAQIALVVFGVGVTMLLGPFNGRQSGAFWSLLFSLAYVLAGIWVGRLLIILGAAIAALTVAGYLWSGAWYALWMAAAYGGGLILGGWWLRHEGAVL